MTVPFSPFGIYSPIPNHKGLTEKDFIDILPGKFKSYFQFLLAGHLGITPQDELFLGNG